MNNDMRALNERIDDYKSQIAKEEEKLREAQEGKKERLLAEVKQKEDDIASKQNRIEELKESIRVHVEKQEEARKAYDEALSRDQSLRDEIVGCDTMIENLKRAAQGELNKYGHNLRVLLSEIDKQQWRGRKPAGPFGINVKLQDPQWKRVLQTQIGRHMTSFVVENSADRSKLLQMLKQSNK